MGLDFLVPIFGILLFLVPITGLTVVLTAKFATKPIVEALSQLRVGEGTAGTWGLEGQVRDLSEQVEALSAEVRRLREAQDFDRQLMAPAGIGSTKGGPGT